MKTLQTIGAWTVLGLFLLVMLLTVIEGYRQNRHRDQLRKNMDRLKREALK